MSNIEAQILYDPRLAQIDDSKKTYMILRGGQNIQYYPFTYQSKSNTNISFKCDPPSFDTVVGRHAILRVPVRIQLAGLSAELTKHMYSLRAYPLSSIIQSATVNINGQSISMEVANMVHILSRYNNNPVSRSEFGSILPNVLDVFQKYSVGFGTSSNPLGTATEMVQGVRVPRGAYPQVVVASGTTSATLEFDIYEYVMLSPFYSRKQEGEGGLALIRNLSFNFQLGDLARVFSMSDYNGNPSSTTPTTLTAATVDVIGEPTIYMNFITPPEGFSVPRAINFNFNDYNYYSIERTPVAFDGSTQTIVSNVIQFGQLPERVYIAVHRAKAQVNASVLSQVTTTDTFARIKRVNINFANRDGIHSATTPVDLYRLSVANGLSMSWSEFDGKTQYRDGTSTTTDLLTGSIVAFEFGKDIPLTGFDSVGMSKAWNFQVQVDYENISGDVFTPQLSIVAVQQGILTLEAPGQANISLGFITPSDVANATVSDESYERIRKLYGGAHSGMVPRLLQKAMNKVKGSALAGGALAGGLSAGALSGGAIMSRQSLKDRALR
jgi:hypothetical protein